MESGEMFGFVMGIFVIILVIILVIWAFIELDKGDVECLESIAKSACNERNMTFYDLSDQLVGDYYNSFRCNPEKDERKVLNYGDYVTLKFLTEEMRRCNIKRGFLERNFA